MRSLIPPVKKLPADPRTTAADRGIVRQPGTPAPSVKEQLQREIDRNRQQGHASDRDLNVQQKTERDNLMRDTFQPKPAQPETNAGKPKWGISGELNDGRARPRDGPTDFTTNVGVTYGVGKVQDPLDEQLHELLPLLTKTFGAEGRETPRCRSELIATYSGQGSPAQAEGEHRSLILTDTRVLGAEAPETLKSRRCLAYALSRQKKLADGMRSQKKRAEAEQQRAVKAATPAQSFSPRSKNHRQISHGISFEKKTLQPAGVAQELAHVLSLCLLPSPCRPVRSP